MAVYKIFPEKDATIYSAFPSMNTGRDEILEIANLNPSSANIPEDVRRTLIKFSTGDISEVINDDMTAEARVSQSYSASLRLFTADATSIPIDYNIQAFPVYIGANAKTYDMGTGKFLDSPQTTNGVSWTFRIKSGSEQWILDPDELPSDVSLEDGVIPGGGNWYINNSVYDNIQTNQRFFYNDDTDINIDVTDAVKAFYTASLSSPSSIVAGGIINDGFLLKLAPSVEFSNTYMGLKFFSVDTHTIYPPCLEIKWNDTVYSTGSLPTISDTPFVVTFESSQPTYTQGSTQRFRLNVRPQFPTRTFQTSSVYLNNHYLPQESFYAIKDLDTGEFEINFDDVFTKISADSTSSYFDVFMNGLQPERYYKVCIKTTIDGSTVILSEGLTFKVSL
ncbi:hypothetical protein [Haliea sp.]|uniref:hypothetical protein n=1 Tax=Haliea sp. TaxID=1932666 RepID=UPI00257D9A4A|nr:hypothetical protein [Haliea sp.]